MSSFKQLTSHDIIISPYTSNKVWRFSYGEYVDNGIDILRGTKSYTPLNINTSPSYSGFFENLVYNSINHLYYQNFYGYTLDSGSMLRTLNYENYEDIHRPSASYYDYSDKTFGVKNIPSGSSDQIYIITVPKEKYGTRIKPGSLILKFFGQEMLDDKYGNIKDGDVYIGNIIYSHGLIILTDSSYFSLIPNSKLEFKGEHEIFEQTFKCNIKDYEFNYTYNPTTLQNKDNKDVKYFVTGSTFRPYMTTIGLYNDNNELLAVGKFGKPIPISLDTNTSVVVKLDL